MELTIEVEGGSVSGLLDAPKHAHAAVVLAHGAGAGMAHPFMAAVAKGLNERGIAVLRYQFPYMERGSKRTDTPKVAQGAVRAAVDEAARRLPGLPLFAGGKSFGGRMSSQAQAAGLLPATLGLLFFGFPLHPPGKPGTERGQHLADIQVPMLFLQGSRDEFAELELLQAQVKLLGQRARLTLLQDADHSFHVPARSGRKDSEVLAGALDAAAGWIDEVLK